MTDETRTELPETETGLISHAQQAVSRCNWTVGECAMKWTRKYAKGRTDADFAAMVGLSPDQVYQRRRVSETFCDVSSSYPSLKWSHFYLALTWDDAPECLQWAEENEETVAGMKAWRRAMRGEDLTEETPVDEFAGDPAVAYLSDDLNVVRDPSEWEGREGNSGDFSSGSSGGDPAKVVAGAARAAGSGDDTYSPFRSDAASPGPSGSGESSTATLVPKPTLSPEQAIKRITTAIERVNKTLTPEFLEAFGALPPKQRDRFTRAVAELSNKAAGLL